MAPWEHFFDQNDPSAFETVITDGFGRLFGPETRFGSPKRVLELLFHFWTQKSCAWQVLHKGKRGPFKFSELLASRALLGTTWATWGPPGAEGLGCPWPQLSMASAAHGLSCLWPQLPMASAAYGLASYGLAIRGWARP